MTSNLFEELAWRGLIYDKTEGVEALLANEKVTAYIGFDPTADSLHVGSLLPILSLVRLQQFGHTPIALIGGATGMIGDPSGKSQERNLLSAEQLAANVAGIRAQLSHFIDFERKGNPAQILNNYDWLGSFNFIDFLREVGKSFTINYMMSKESVKRRINSEEGISYTEFTYMMLQSYDFFHLNKHHDCVLQMGGSDQWGNITAGTDYIRRQGGKKAYGVVSPLITNSSGAKFGKTEQGNIWLDPKRTSPYRFYQFWMNAGDDEVVHYLKVFTFLKQAEIEALAQAVQDAPAERTAQRRLAEEMTLLVHGRDELEKVQRATELVFGGRAEGLTADLLLSIEQEMPLTEIPREKFLNDGIWVAELLVSCGVTKSNGEARRLITGNGLKLNGTTLSDFKANIKLDQSVEDRYFMINKGRKHRFLVKVI
ncbi:tyrosine--tRNA ligase [Acanthopleuribacter pedis]|uniref:Tyrosine--tRNA ligase n=1 Tax=Acanthopleuribacter pedis TaxID=442870 RepID=A0A8J7Q9N9_9BACT|nr:tyrosine--tRNA ligase [Acanthopleuribacter pedis]MBO1321241.1 tyrosine--tRNA ligase [Acanthopleuribacter pedis]